MGPFCNSFTNKVAGLRSIDKFTENKMFDKDIFQQTVIDLQDVFKTCLDRPYDTKLKVRGLKFKRASVSELKT